MWLGCQHRTPQSTEHNKTPHTWICSIKVGLMIQVVYMVRLKYGIYHKNKNCIMKVKGVLVDALNKRQQNALKNHSKHHTVKHIRSMVNAMKKGKTFSLGPFPFWQRRDESSLCVPWRPQGSSRQPSSRFWLRCQMLYELQVRGQRRLAWKWGHRQWDRKGHSRP